MVKYLKAVKFVSISPKVVAAHLLAEEATVVVVASAPHVVAVPVEVVRGVTVEVVGVTVTTEDPDLEMMVESLVLKEDIIVAKLQNQVMAAVTKVDQAKDHAGINQATVSSGITSASTRYTNNPVPKPKTAIRNITLIIVGSMSK